MLLLSLLLLVELPVLLYLIRSKGFSPFPHLNLVYFVGAQIAIYLVSSGIAKYRFLRTFTTGAYTEHYTASLLLFAAMFLAFALAFPAPRSRAARVGAETLRSFRLTGLALSGVVVALVAYHAALFALLDWPSVWSNRTYLLMGKPEILRYEWAASVLLVFKLVGLLTVTLAVFLRARRHRLLFLVLAPFAALDIAYQLAAHSRAAVLYIGMAGALHFILTRRKRAFWLSMGAAVLALMWCWAGRRYGVHGLSSFGSAVPILRAYFADEPLAILINPFEGAFATAEMFKRTFQPNARYELLSFSPLVSGIDGYEALRARWQYELGPFSPPPALFELRSFSWPYAVLYALVQIVAGRLVLRLYGGRGSFVALGLNILMCFACYFQFTYTVRHVFRIFLAIIVVGLIASAAQAFNQQHQPNKRYHPGAPRHRHPNFRAA